MRRRNLVVALVMAMVAVVLGGCGSVRPKAKYSTLIGYVYATQDAVAQAGPTFTLHLSATEPAIGYELAYVRLETADGKTLERRTLPDGSFAAYVASGNVRVTAYAPPYVDGVSPSPSLVVNAATDRVTRLDGIVLGQNGPASAPSGYFPLNVGDKHYWSTWDTVDPRQWWRFMCGTTVVNGTTAHVLLTPNGRPPFVERTAAAEAVGLGQMYAHGASGTLLYMGGADLIQEDGGSLGFMGHPFDQPLGFTPLALGNQVEASGSIPGGFGEPIDVTLPAGTQLADFVDPSGGSWQAEFPGEDGEGVLVMAAIGQEVTTPAGTFTDTIVLDWLSERSPDGSTETTWQRITLAKNVGSVLDEGEVYDVAPEEVIDNGTLVDWWDDHLVFAEVSGEDLGTYPVAAGGGTAEASAAAEARRRVRQR